MSEDFVGRGWAFPLRTGPTGGIALVSREREIEEAIRLILGTALGERPMRPEYGCAIHDYVFAPFNPNTEKEMIVAVKASLMRWEPRVEVTSVRIVQDGNEPALLYIDIV